VNAAIFFGRKNVLTDGKVIAVAVDQLEGKHAALSIQHSASPLVKDSI
jgi:hypothetical protein